MTPSYDEEQRRHVAMPLGGIGTGQVAICGDGGLRQWQLHNVGNHTAYIPDSFFCIRVSRPGFEIDLTRVLQSPVPPGEPTPSVNDDYVPERQRQLIDSIGGVESTTFHSSYPFARIDFRDPELPIDIELEAFTPLVPHDTAASSVPAALFTFTIRNPSDHHVHGWLGGTLQNAVGWDGITPIDGTRCPTYGGNVNRLRRNDGWTSVVLENPSLPHDHPGAGQMALSTDGVDARASLRWTTPEQFAAFVRSCPWEQPSTHGPSQISETWNAGLATRFDVKPGAEQQVKFVMTWSFPNRYADADQPGPRRDFGLSRFWLGNHYATVFPDAVATADHVAHQWDDLRAKSMQWSDALTGSSLPDVAAERLAAQLAYLRSPTCFRTADGRFYGFEGVRGASTPTWPQHGGSCPLNCTHVWNYEQTISRLFPELERDMRDTEWTVMQSPEGYLPHRIVLPPYLKQLWDVPIGGPSGPALDGMLGAVLKTYREVRNGAGLPWLQGHWPQVRKLLDFVIEAWDPERIGVLRGIQPSTHDIDLSGVNTFMGTLYLAALRATDAMATLLGEDGSKWRKLAESGGAEYDKLTWNGEYFAQVLDADADTTWQWGKGCLSDQLVGQWWAHQLDLGYVLPEEHVRTALQSVVRHNFRDSLADFEHSQRVFADRDDAGLLMASWPHGGRPERPTAYCDEVWTGVEYQVAAHCLMEGLDDEAQRILQAMWKRYDGSRRNPFNEVECGDHYVRAMAGWSVLEEMCGLRYDATTATLRLGSGERLPVVTDNAWGTATRDGDTVRIACHHGTMRIGTLRLRGQDVSGLRARTAFGLVRSSSSGDSVSFERAVELTPGGVLELS